MFLLYEGYGFFTARRSLGRYSFHFHRDLVIATLLVAVADLSFLFGGLFQEVRRTALGALLWNRLVPNDEVAGWILGAAIKHFTALGTTLDQFPAATRFRTWDANEFGFDIFALWVIAA